jgi:CBS domain-containing protein
VDRWSPKGAWRREAVECSFEKHNTFAKRFCMPQRPSPARERLSCTVDSLAVTRERCAPCYGGACTRKDQGVHATEIAARLGQGMALLFGGVGLFFNPILLFIAVFVWMGARQESTMVGLKRALSGVPIGSAMVTEFRVLSPSDRLSSAAEHIVAGFQHDFPVVDGTRLVGVLTRSDIVRGLPAGGGEASVASAMHREFATAHPADLLEGVLSGRQLPEAVPIVIVSNDAVVGLLTAENIGDVHPHAGRSSSQHRTRCAVERLGTEKP